MLSENRSLVQCLGLLLVVTFLIRRLRQWQRLRHIPGPPLAGFSRLFWLVPMARSGDLPGWMRVAEQKYGRIVRVGPNMLMTTDWKLWRRIMSARSRYVRAERFKGFRLDPTKDHVLSLTDEREHSRLRTIMIHGYSGKEVEGVEEKVDHEVLSLVDLLESRYISQNKIFDFGRKAQYFTTDVVAHITFGRPLGFLATDSDVYNYISIIEKQLPVIGMMLNYPGFVKLLNWPIFNRLLPKAEDESGMGKLMGLAKEAAAERFGPNKKVQKDMLGSFVARGLTQDEVEAEIPLQLLAGSDTTATAIRTTVLLVTTNPRVLRKLQAEIDSVAPYPKDQVIRDETAKALPYLNAVVKEGLRWAPPGVDLSAKVVPPGGDEWEGVVLPAGAEIGWNATGLMRVPELFGDDADHFRPERWTDPNTSPEKRKDMETAGDLVFGVGSRYQCLGRTIALMEIRKAIFELYRRYEFEVIHPDKPWLSRCWNVYEQHEFWVKAYTRDSASTA
ncbi:cytochrome P450 [Corynascus novoguineensis]|uniref:Cytochrome P450 n=1 Tax=Corynascus novoguineensis TaxID=1126955 RepID=A0AAN7HMY7_9PEZI|nr:cytochrome P450 [Corynascus novoguineensis]